ncbi:MAG: hypothetical protein K2O45_01170, partial [Oscillospiraceae bacterium]|nr:hypothetical protein [Oscillospiraceae bacterium]
MAGIIGRIILWILLGLVLLVIALLQIPLKIRASYEGGAAVLRVQYGPWKRQLFPAMEDGEKDQPSEKKPPKPKKNKNKKKKPKAGINREQIFYALEKLPPI